METLNPLRYRGYVYDQETGLYYLQSRYYNPEMGRFINADKYVSTGQGLLGNNMFAYCGNNPVINVDTTGLLFEKNAGGGGGGLAYAGPAGGHIVRPTTPSNPTIFIPYIPLSTTYGIDALRMEKIDIMKNNFAAKKKKRKVRNLKHQMSNTQEMIQVKHQGTIMNGGAIPMNPLVATEAHG